MPPGPRRRRPTSAPTGPVTSPVASTRSAGCPRRSRTSRGRGSSRPPSCSSAAGTGSTASAFWVGLGGNSGTSNALEQTGTESDCAADGTASYSAWYELVPPARCGSRSRSSPETRSPPRSPSSGTKVTVRMQNLTRGVTFARTLTMAVAGYLVGRLDRRGPLALLLELQLPPDRAHQLRHGQVLEGERDEQRARRRDLRQGVDGHRDHLGGIRGQSRLRALCDAVGGRRGPPDRAAGEGERVLGQVEDRSIGPDRPRVLRRQLPRRLRRRLPGRLRRRVSRRLRLHPPHLAPLAGPGGLAALYDRPWCRA